MAEEENKKIGFGKKLIMSIKDFDKYGVLASENIGKAMSYLLKVLFIFTIIVAGIFTYHFSKSINEAIEYFKQNIHEISYNQQGLTINQGEKIEIQNEDAMIQSILIDTDASEEEMKSLIEKLGEHENGILILNQKIVYHNTVLGQNVEYSYSDIANSYHITAFDKEQVLDFLNQISPISLYSAFFIVMFIYLYVIYLVSTLVDVFMLAVLGFIISRIAGMRLRLKATFNIGVYALTLPILLNLIYIIVNNFTGFTIQYFQWMYTTISYIYVIVAILMIKTDFVNKQMELMKIIEEQEKVKQEMQEREEQKKQEEKKDVNPEEKKESKEDGNPEEKKKKQKEKKDNNLKEGLAPQESKELPNNESQEGI